MAIRPRRQWLVSGNDQTVQQFSRDRRDESVASSQVELEMARAVNSLINGVMYVIGGGPERDMRRMEIDAEMMRLGLQCHAFQTAITAMLQTERERTKQFQALTRALPHMTPEAHHVAVQILERLATGAPKLTAPPMPQVARGGR